MIQCADCADADGPFLPLTRRVLVCEACVETPRGEESPAPVVAAAPPPFNAHTRSPRRKVNGFSAAYRDVLRPLVESRRSDMNGGEER